MTKRYPGFGELAVCGLLLLAVGGVFGQTITFEFINLDDPLTVYENPHVSPGLTAEGTVRAFTHTHAFSWVPLTCLSQMVDCQVFGLWAGGHHLTNCLLHAATAILLFLVLRNMTGNFWPSAFVAIVFAVHPLQVESVAWVTARKDVLSGLFFVLTLWAYVSYVRQPFSMIRYLAVMELSCLGMMAKSMLVTLPVVLLLLDYWPLGRNRGSGSPTNGGHELPGAHGNGSVTRYGAVRLIVEKVPLLVMAMVFGMLAVWGQGAALDANDIYPLTWRIGSALMAYVGYLGHFTYPSGLAVLYPRPDYNLPVYRVLAATLILLLITAAAVVSRRRRPYLLVGWLWYLASLLPVIGLVQFGSQTVADRFMYLPLIGLGIAVAWWADDLCRSGASSKPRRLLSIAFRRWLFGFLAILVTGVLAACAWRQATFWQDSETLWTHTLDCTPNNSLAHHHLGVALSDWGLDDAAMEHFLEVRKVGPYYLVGMKHIHAPLAPSERARKAITHYRRALERKPDDIDAKQRLAWLLATCGDAAQRNGDEAVAIARQLAGLANGKQPEALDTLAAAYAEAGRFQEALAAAQRALELARQQKKNTFADDVNRRIALYQTKKAYHQP